MIKINLMPPEEKKDSGKQLAFKLPTNLMNLLLAVPILITIALVGVVYMKMEQEIKDLDKRHIAAQAELKDLEGKVKIVDSLKVAEAQLAKRLANIQKLNANRDFWENVYVEVCEKLPEEFIALTGFNDASDSESGKSIKVIGLALSNLQVSDYISRLRLSKYVKDVDLTNTKSDKYKGRDAISFGLYIALVAPQDSTGLGRGGDDDSDDE